MQLNKVICSVYIPEPSTNKEAGLQAMALRRSERTGMVLCSGSLFNGKFSFVITTFGANPVIQHRCPAI